MALWAGVAGVFSQAAVETKLSPVLDERAGVFLIGCKRIEISQLVALAYRLSVRMDGSELPLSSLATAD